MSRRGLIMRYAAFAVIATLVNLGVQRAILVNGTTVTTLASAILAGTAAGLAVKYVLDKRWIFYDRTTGLRPQGTMFLLYSVNGLVTTAVFWVSEAAFWFIWQTAIMREVGAVIGLTIGYAAKFHLDSRFVFTTTDSGARP
ncbi:MAG: GtrA family protein [Candidatus Puniceispirillaceae bacterium]